MKRKWKIILSLTFILIISMMISGCTGKNELTSTYIPDDLQQEAEANIQNDIWEGTETDNETREMPEAPEAYSEEETESIPESHSLKYEDFDWSSIPDYTGEAVLTINGDEPLFEENEKVYQGTYIHLSELDALGRCGVASACVGKETEPTSDREDISQIYPSGWVQRKLSNGEWLYNRSHLLMFALSGLNAEPRNLITGTRNFNASKTEGMLAWEIMVKSAVDNYNAHVLYRVTPVYNGNDLVAKGVLMEAYCIEYPEECTYCRFIYNVQPNVAIDYATGKSTEIS